MSKAKVSFTSTSIAYDGEHDRMLISAVDVLGRVWLWNSGRVTASEQWVLLPSPEAP